MESVLEDFEKKTATIEDKDAVCTHVIISPSLHLVLQVEEQRRYLGGDKDHTILVKGLDFALLEQNKARAMSSHNDDESLEAAFQEAQPMPLVPKKRTRADIIRELKEKRTSTSSTGAVTQASMNKPFEDAKKVGKFKPIGAPDNTTGHELSNKSKGKGHDKAGRGDRKKKRRKVEHMIAADKHHNEASMANPSSEKHILSSLPPHDLSPDSPNEHHNPNDQVLEPDSIEDPEDEVDIFADAGEYEGVDFGEDEGEEQRPSNVDSEERVVSHAKLDNIATVKGWFIEDEPTSAPNPSPAMPLSTPPIKTPVPPEPDCEETEPTQVIRLAPLASSVLPSISDFLAMDAEADAKKKRKTKKEKTKGGEKTEKGRTDVKLDRDYKRSVDLHLNPFWDAHTLN